MSGQDLVVNRWRRYGKDRLYVETPDGSKVGFWDLVTETGHPESPDSESSLLAAVASWKSTAGLAAAGPAATAPVEADQAASAPQGGDEERNGAGEPAAPVTALVESGDHAADLLLGLPDDATSTHPAEVVDASGSGSVPEPARPWVDLATNSPGAEARERAQAARDSAPVKTVLARVLGVHTNERAWRIGADGEEKVAAQLAKVAKKDPRWRFLHAVPVGNRGSDIDHIIIGPGGVFTANAKHHPGAKIWVGGNTFMVNGAKQPYVRNARHEAQRAAKVLTEACGFPVHVEGLIVTVNASDVVVKTQPEGVSVTPRMQVARWLLRHGDILTPEAIDAVYDVARRSTTWR
ncbi:NERD domain-containing protein [Phycicoccus ginsengisoli]